MALQVDWDPRKAAANEAKHGVTFAEAVTVFADPLARIEDDLRHSQTEQRFVILGLSRRMRLLAVMYTERLEDVRIISAREATRSERSDYEKGEP